jgi:transposase InsO family protein
MHHKLHEKDLKINQNISTDFYLDERLSELIERTKKGIDLWEALKQRGCPEKEIQRITGISRATFFRRKKALGDLMRGVWPPTTRPKRPRIRCWREPQIDLVLKIRNENPTYGRKKIAVILKRDHREFLSESTVGRILNLLKERGLAQRSVSAPRQKQSRNFVGKHAQPFTFKLYDDMEIGERVQIDHMTVVENALYFKEFHAWERKSKHLSTQIFSSATSKNAKEFLLELVENAPYKILSIQVDGGAEFRGDFEQACKELEIPLFILPPASPKYNGGVERSNRTLREELYARNDLSACTLEEMRVELQEATTKYNTYRPHNHLNGMTPMEYINTTCGSAFQSHMS